MALSDYQEDFQVCKRKLFVSVCVYQKPGYRTCSPINRMLKIIQDDLKRELEEYEKIWISYVYETRDLMDVRPFEILTEESSPMYKEPCDYMTSHKLHHVFFMGMALLDQMEQEYDEAETRLYLVTDEKFERINHVVYQRSKGIQMNPVFEESDTKLLLFKSKNAGGDLLETYIGDAQTQVC